METRPWRHAAGPAVILFVVLQGIGGAYTIVNFESSSPTVVAKMSGPGNVFSVNISVPAQCHILRAGMNLTPVGPEPAHPSFPEGGRVLLNDTTIWEFNATGAGQLGRQDEFVNGASGWASMFGPAGGANTSAIRIPRTASVGNASMEAWCGGPGGFYDIVNFTGVSYDWMGFSVAGAGDVNGDGYDDVIIGAPMVYSGGSAAGEAYIHFGGPSMDGVPDLVLKGAKAGDCFGYCVASVGDVNNDSYDDVIVGASYANGKKGTAYIFLGNSSMDGKADLWLGGDQYSEYFGISVSGAGDINGDGYDDVVVGDFGNYGAGSTTGKAWVFFGGAPMDAASDLNMTGEASGDRLGLSVAGAGDVNGDGYDDIIVGADGNDALGDSTGRAYILYGGATPDSSPDLVLTGESSRDKFGYSVSGAGDENGDGYDDVIVGACENDEEGSFAGKAYIFYGGAIKDTNPDVNFTGEDSNDYFGAHVSGAGDVDGDGYGDVVVGAWGCDSGGGAAGKAYVFTGGSKMNQIPDATFTGSAGGDMFGFWVSGAGDVNSDGCDDVVVGAYKNSSGGAEAGRAYLYGGRAGILSPSVTVGKQVVLDRTGYVNRMLPVQDFSKSLNEYLQGPVQVVTDGYGNAFVDVPVAVSAAGNGSIRLQGLNITYNVTAAVPDFSDALNSYIAAHRAEKDANGMLKVPFKVESRTSSRLRLQNLSIVVDAPPEPTGQIPDFSINEDTANTRLVDLYKYFKDDYTDMARLSLELASVRNGEVVNVSLAGNRYISVDAATGAANDNWTGAVDIVVKVSDEWGSATMSNEFTIVVAQVPDRPVITSVPSLNATPRQEYQYRLTAVDGDGDLLTYVLKECPAGMTMDRLNGEMSWIPLAGGLYGVKAAVDDGAYTVFQNFTIRVANQPPRVVNSTVPVAYTGVPFSYRIQAADDDNDTLQYSFMTPVTGMNLDPLTGEITWTPARSGSYPVSVAIGDGNDTARFDFNITVLDIHYPPVFQSVPVTEAITGLPYYCNCSAWDADGGGLAFTLVEAPDGMYINASSGKINWTPASAGNFPVRIKASDVFGLNAYQEFSVNVSNRDNPRVIFLTPLESKKVKGTFTVSGRAYNGTLGVVNVQVRVDDGAWGEANGTSIWLFPLDSSRLKNGEHRLQARAFDGIDYSDPVNRTFAVDNTKAPGGKGMVPGFGSSILVFAVATAMALAFLVHNQKSVFRDRTGRRISRP